MTEFDVGFRAAEPGKRLPPAGAQRRVTLGCCHPVSGGPGPRQEVPYSAVSHAGPTLQMRRVGNPGATGKDAGSPTHPRHLRQPSFKPQKRGALHSPSCTSDSRLSLPISPRVSASPFLSLCLSAAVTLSPVWLHVPEVSPCLSPTPPPRPGPGPASPPISTSLVVHTLCPPQTTQDTQARCPGPTPQPGCSAGAPLSSLSAPKAKPAGVRGRIGSSQPGPAPSLCCSPQAPDARPQNNSSPQPSGWMRVNSASSGAQHGVLAQPGTLPNWPGTPSCPSPPPGCP